MTTEIILKNLNHTLDEWINALNDYTLGELCAQPGADSWSLGQVYLHIIDQTVNFNIVQMEKCLSSDQNSEKGKTPAAMKFFENNSLPDEKIKSPANVALPQPSGISELRSELMRIRASLNELAGKIMESKFKGKSKHPGWLFLTVGEWLQFTDMHLRHHLKQKKRIDEFLGKNNL